MPLASSIRASDVAEVAVVLIQRYTTDAVLRGIRDIGALRAEFELPSLSEVEILEDGEIKRPLRRSHVAIQPSVALCRQLALRELGNGHKVGCVEPLIWRTPS